MKVKIQLLLPVLFLAACSSHNPKSHQSAQRKTEDTVDYAQIKEKGVLRAVTLYSPTSYFLYRMEPMGFEYELIHDFAEGEGLELEVRAARDQAQMLEMLRSGEADVAAYPVVFNKELMAGFTYCGHEEQSSQVLVQAPSSGQAPVNDVTGLIGRDVYVQAGSPYHERLLNLDRELGGGIRIHALSDSLDTKENLIAQVAKGKIPFTVADDKTARLNHTYFWNLDVHLHLSFRQRASWLVRKSSPALAAAIDHWAKDTQGERAYKTSLIRYFEFSKKEMSTSLLPPGKGQLSPYDHLFRKHAALLGYDWRLLASIAYQESRFRPHTLSWAGAHGLMGIMPGTAKTLKIPMDELDDPDVNIRAGAEVLRRFRQSLSRVISDSVELLKFTLASYNAGIGHIFDARRLAAKYGKDSSRWDGNVAEFVLLKSDPKYYGDPVCRYGYMRGTETYAYVTDVVGRFKRWRSVSK